MINLILDGDNALRGAADRIVDCGENIQIICLAAGTRGGRPSITLALAMPDGNVAVGQATMRELITAVDGMKARWPEMN